MDTKQERFKFLLDKYLEKTCTLEELQEFFSFLEQPQFREEFDAVLKEGFKSAVPSAEVHMVDWDEMYASIVSQPEQKIIPVWLNLARAAAIVIIAFSAALLLWKGWRSSEQAKDNNLAAIHAEDIKPGNNKAILKLGNGQEVMLDGTGVLESRGGDKIRKTASGIELYFDQEAGNSAAEVHTVTLSTSVGGQYMLILPDNSKVWLNANSSVSFPSAFTGDERNVEVSGEAYFEVSKDKQHPFKVKSRNSVITVLGTQFNVMAYDDEPKTEVSLAEGAVRLNLGKNSCILTPGQQASFNNDSDHIKLGTVAVDDIAGWKNGLFQFDNTPIEQVMRQVQRWYNVKVVYEESQSDISITAMISKSNTISKILDLLTESSGLTFEVKDKMIIVKSPKRPK